jgi:(2R)-sulfolactate sulfo-lyase subunit beta
MATKAKSSKSRRNLSFMGWRRENGRVGVRNHVVILPLDDLSNAACEAVANNIKGTMALPHAYGRLQFGADLDLQPQRCRCDRDRHRGRLDQARG